MSYPPQIDPYVVLGVPTNVSLPDIKAAHRKLVLKYHPDKVKDDSLRNKAQDEFQKVQQAYELLSDPSARAKYDQDARLAELKRDVFRERAAGAGAGAAANASSWFSPRTTSREYRDGRIYEERVPAGAAFFFDENDDVEFTEEPPQTSRKYEDFPRRQPRSKTAGFAGPAGGGGSGGGGGGAAGMDDRRRTRTYPSPFGNGNNGYGSAAKASFYADINKQRARQVAKELAKQREKEHEKERARERAKERTKERKRETLEKMRAAYVEPDDSYSSESDASPIYVNIKRSSESRKSYPEPSSTRYHDPTASKARAESSRRPNVDYVDVDVDDGVDNQYVNGYDKYNKHDYLHTSAYDYIQRCKGTTPSGTMTEADRLARARARARASQSPPEPEAAHANTTASASASSRRTGRYAGSRDRVHAPYDPVNPQFDSDVPPLPREATVSGSVGGDNHTSSPRPSLPRAATAPHGRSRRDRYGHGRSESILHSMAYTETGPIPRTSKTRVNLDRHDSGYSSPGTPDMPSGFGSPKPSSARYDPDSVGPDRPIPPPQSSSPKYHRNYSPLHPERPRMSVRSESKPSRSSTFYAYPSGAGVSSRYESPRIKAKLFDEVEFTKSPKDRDVRYAREVGLDDVIYPRSYVDHHHHQPFTKRTATYA